MQTHSAKQDAIEAINRLPDNAPLDEIVYRLYVLNKIQQGMKDVDDGRGIPSEELAREIEQW
jgi:predicted transcriptional regulator